MTSLDAPHLDGNYSDVHGSYAEAEFLAKFMYKTRLIKHLAKWDEWIDANEKRLHFSRDEKTQWRAIRVKASKAKPGQLGVIARELNEFWSGYFNG